MTSQLGPPKNLNRLLTHADIYSSININILNYTPPAGRLVHIEFRRAGPNRSLALEADSVVNDTTTATMSPPVEDIDLRELERLDAESLLRFAFETFGPRAAIGTSLQKTGVVAIDLVHKLDIPYRVFFIDTLMNNPETYELFAEVQQRYEIPIEVFAPTDEELDSLHRTWGQYAHFVQRATCCHTRKRLPMQRAMQTMDAWISGLRSDQSEHRQQEASKVSWTLDNQGRRILKINPLLDWTAEQVDRYTRQHALPYNKLYDYVSPYNERYTTIGCKACHIPIHAHWDLRSGKFPWEQGRKKCGLHDRGSGI